MNKLPEEYLTCCFTGHRANKLPWGYDESDPRCTELKNAIYGSVEALYAEGCRAFICGMANGCDMYFGEAVLRLKEKYPDVSLEAAIPCDAQADKWPEDLKARYEILRSSADRVTYVQHDYTRYCMMRRNRYMVDSSDVLLACCSGQPGGTVNTVLMAKRAGLKTYIIEITE